MRLLTLLHSAHEFIEYCHTMNEMKKKMKRNKYEQKSSHTRHMGIVTPNTKQTEYRIRSLTRWTIIWPIYNLNDDFNFTCHLIRLYSIFTYVVFAVLCTVLDSQSKICVFLHRQPSIRYESFDSCVTCNWWCLLLFTFHYFNIRRSVVEFRFFFVSVFHCWWFV